jgi:hypothetical protein
MSKNTIYNSMKEDLSYMEIQPEIWIVETLSDDYISFSFLYFEKTRNLTLYRIEFDNINDGNDIIGFKSPETKMLSSAKYFAEIDHVMDVSAEDYSNPDFSYLIDYIIANNINYVWKHSDYLPPTAAKYYFCYDILKYYTGIAPDAGPGWPDSLFDGGQVIYPNGNMEKMIKREMRKSNIYAQYFKKEVIDYRPIEDIPLDDDIITNPNLTTQQKIDIINKQPKGIRDSLGLLATEYGLSGISKEENWFPNGFNRVSGWYMVFNEQLSYGIPENTEIWKKIQLEADISSDKDIRNTLFLKSARILSGIHIVMVVAKKNVVEFGRSSEFYLVKYNFDKAGIDLELRGNVKNVYGFPKIVNKTNKYLKFIQKYVPYNWRLSVWSIKSLQEGRKIALSINRTRFI